MLHAFSFVVVRCHETRKGARAGTKFSVAAIESTTVKAIIPPSHIHTLNPPANHHLLLTNRKPTQQENKPHFAPTGTPRISERDMMMMMMNENGLSYLRTTFATEENRRGGWLAL